MVSTHYNSAGGELIQVWNEMLNFILDLEQYGLANFFCRLTLLECACAALLNFKMLLKYPWDSFVITLWNNEEIFFMFFDAVSTEGRVTIAILPIDIKPCSF